MANFDTGVSSYIKCYTVIDVNFPVDRNGFADVACKYCPYLASNERMCQLNKLPVAYPNKFVGDNCPLIQKEEQAWVN